MDGGKSAGVSISCMEKPEEGREWQKVLDNEIGLHHTNRSPGSCYQHISGRK